MQAAGSPGCDGPRGSSSSSSLLTVDEGARPRALSEPSCDVSSLQPAVLLLPEITVEDCTDQELSDIADGRPAGQGRGLDPAGLARPRANTCPEDLFQKPRGERPPTPPPGAYRKGRRFQSGFSKPVVKETVSFAHHRLCKLTESEDAEDDDSDGDGGDGVCGGGGGSDPDLTTVGASAAAARTAAGIERLRLSSHPASSWPARSRGRKPQVKHGLGGPELRAEGDDIFLGESDSSSLPPADMDSLATGGASSSSGGGGGGGGSDGGGSGGSLLAVKTSRRAGSTEHRPPDSRFAMTGNQRSVVPATRLTIF